MILSAAQAAKTKFGLQPFQNQLIYDGGFTIYGRVAGDAHQENSVR